jgi:hypothetical protein
LPKFVLASSLSLSLLLVFALLQFENCKQQIAPLPSCICFGASGASPPEPDIIGHKHKVNCTPNHIVF